MAERAISVRDGRMSAKDDMRIPADHESHACTIMAWAVHREWGALREQVERELDCVIRCVAEYEPVALLTPPELVSDVRGRRFGPAVELVPAPVDDIWMRDIAPVFAKRGAETVAFDFNFNAWDNSRTGRPGDRLARIHDFGVPVIGTSFVGEGGAFVTNGRGLAITTRSCLLSRNPHLNETAIAAAFERVGIHELVWLEGDRSEPITTGHADGYVAFLPGGGLAVELAAADIDRSYDVAILRQMVNDGRIRSLSEVPSPLPSSRQRSKREFAGTYLNLHPVNGAVLTASFGARAGDDAAEHALRILYPKRKIRMLSIDAIASGGGGIRCLTQPVPL
jgi:agmatine deiminase